MILENFGVLYQGSSRFNWDVSSWLFPIMMFGLPAAGIAIYQCARSEKKKQVGSILLSAAFASFLTGVTEPLEFSFMFVAPFLYIIHAVLTGIMMFIAAFFNGLQVLVFSRFNRLYP